MARYLPVSIVSLTVGGWLGTHYGKNTLRNNQETSEKTLPFVFPAVSASSAVVPHSSDIQRTPTKGSSVGQIMKYGFPSLENIRSFDEFVLAYDRRNRTPHWVFEQLNAEKIKKHSGVQRDKCHFHEDLSINQFFRATNSDYKKSGYDRGHLAAAGNHQSSQRAMEQTFILSNMSPQVTILYYTLLYICITYTMYM